MQTPSAPSSRSSDVENHVSFWKLPVPTLPLSEISEIDRSAGQAFHLPIASRRSLRSAEPLGKDTVDARSVMLPPAQPIGLPENVRLPCASAEPARAGTQVAIAKVRGRLLEVFMVLAFRALWLDGSRSRVQRVDTPAAPIGPRSCSPAKS